MFRSVARISAATALFAAILAVPAGAAPSAPALWTQISVPSSALHYHFEVGATNHLHVAGQTSGGITQVNIICVVFVVGEETNATPLASAVPVVAHSFNAVATLPTSPPANCRLRAVPTGIDPTTDYLGSYTGPILYTDAFGTATDGGKVYSFTAQSEEGDGVVIATDVGSCGTEALVTIEAPQMQAGPLVLTCLFGLQDKNIDPSGSPTRSAIRVDGHNAYLPSGVHEFRSPPQSLTVSQTALTVNRSIAHNGDVTVTESAALKRCSVSDHYPPTTGSCPALVATGVTFKRVSKFFRNGHQVQIRDTFSSTDHHRHTMTLQYLGAAENETSGGSAATRAGFAYPGHGSTFHQSTLGQTVTGFGAKPGTLLIRSDVHARADDPQADTTAATWSRPPSKITFATDPTEADQFGMAYNVKVPAGGTARLAFATSERWLTADVKRLAALAIADFGA